MSFSSRAVRLAVALVAPIALSGCLDLSGPDACTAEWVPGLDVAVERADTGEPLAEALVVARDGGFADTARTRLASGSPDRAAAKLAHERSGEYDVTVEKEGYEPSVRHDVDVQENECHVETVEITVGLEPS